MTRLPDVLAVISRPSRIDTPDEISVPSVRVKRDTADFRSTSPSTGIFNRSLSIVSFQPDVPPGDFRSIPYSFAGVGARLSVVLAEGMRRGIPVERLSHLLTDPCPSCEGKGRIKSVATIAYEIMRRVRLAAAASPESRGIVVRAHPAVAAFLCEDESAAMDLLEREIAWLDRWVLAR